MATVPAARYLIDTSVLIGLEQEQEREIGGLPTLGSAMISVVTVGELHRGVLTARSDAGRRQRLATYRDAVELFDALPIDATVAVTWAEYEAHLRADGRRVDDPDTWIAATAATHGLVLMTQDHGFQRFPDLDLLLV